MKRLAFLLARLLHAVALAVAIVVCLTAIALLWLEHSGWFVNTLSAELTGRLGSVGGQVEIDSVSLDWFKPAAVLAGVRVDRNGRVAELGRIYVELRVVDAGAGRWIDRVDIEGGRVRLCRDLLDVLAAAEAGGGGPPAAGAQKPERAPVLPLITLRGVQLDLSHPEWGDLPIGVLEAVWASDVDGRPRIEGRIQPSFAARGPGGSAIYLGGRAERPGTLAVHLSTDGLEIGVDALPNGTVLERFRKLEPRGVMRLDARARLSLDRAEPSGIELRASLDSASFRPPTTSQLVEDLHVDLEARCAPRPGEDWIKPLAWESRAALTGSWNAARFSGEVLLGRNAGPDLVARGSLACAEVPIAKATLTGLGLEPQLASLWAALEPRGQVDAACGLRLSRDGDPDLCVDVRADGRAGVTYHGFTDAKGAKEGGFPLPLDAARGRFVALFDPRRSRPMVLGLLGLTGAHGGGTIESRPARCDGLIVSPARDAPDPPTGPHGKLPELELLISASNVAVDDTLRKALDGLPDTGWIWPAFSPHSGSVDARAHLLLTRVTHRLAVHVDAEFRGMGATWTEVPIPLEAAQGQLVLDFDPRLAFGVSFAASGTTPTAESVRVRGRVQQDPAHSRTAEPHAALAAREHELIQCFEVEADGMALRGSDRTVIERTWNGVGAALDEFAPAGKADVRFRGARAIAGGEFAYQVEIVPRQVQLTPKTFNMPTRNVRGRVLVDGRMLAPMVPGAASRSQVETRIAPLLGEWGGDARIACTARFPSDGPDEITVYGAGVDVTNRALVGAFREAFAGGGQRGDGGLDLSALAIDGRIDFAGSIAIPEAHGEESSASYRVYLRDNDFRTGAGSGFGLQSLRGVLVQQAGVLNGERISAVLAHTAVELEDARFVEHDGAYRLETRVAAHGLPLDREHLGFFLDEGTIRSLLDELHLVGAIDIEDARLTLTGAGSGNGQVSFQGRLSPRSMAIDLGLPLAVETADVELKSLVFEDGRVRAWAEVSDLNGALADRRLHGARMVVTYIEPHLSLIDLTGELEGGTIRDLSYPARAVVEAIQGPMLRRGGTAFSIDLVEPFPFDIGLRLEEVEIAGMLRGMFESEFADTGRLDAELRLSGNLQKLTGITGEGSVHMRDTRLWSIPVMRRLFSQLGFDNTAVFDQMRTRFRLKDGVIHMDAIRVNSPLLELVGQGTLDLDGRLHHDLEVRYDLVDNLGPLTRLVYWVQNNLLSVAVRGDMSRPKVVLKGALSFLRRDTGEKRELPLPGFSPLPARF